MLSITAMNYYSGKTINNLLRTSLEPDGPMNESFCLPPVNLLQNLFLSTPTTNGYN
jgi:hypothetical protein